MHRVADAHLWKRPAPRLPFTGVPGRDEAGRPGGAVASAEDIGGDHIVFVGVYHGAGANDTLPPAITFNFGGHIGGGAFGGTPAGDVSVPGEGVQDQDGVVAVFVEGAPGFVADAHLRQGNTVL